VIRTSRSLLVTALLAQAGALVAEQAGPAPAARITATGAAELTDPAGDVQPIVYLEGKAGAEKEVKYPGLDVVKLTVSSDGRALTFGATLNAAPAQAAYEVLEFHVDADNNPRTGITHPDAPTIITGMEFYGTLEVCLERDLFGTTCAGTDAKPMSRSAVVTLEQYGRDWMFKDTLISFPAAGKVKEPRKTPITATLVQSSVDYASMGLKPGQTIRLVVREYCAGKIKNVPQGYFPEIVLTIK
jgi:hypothetical protein